MFEQYNLYQHYEAIEDITNRANKKFGLSKQLKEMKEKMKGLEIQQRDYKGTFLVAGIDDINT
jgi:hypothetical protein